MGSIKLYKLAYEYGKQNEDNVLPLIKEHFNSDSIEPTTEKYDRFDYIDNKNKIYYELYTRTNSYNTYPTTLLYSKKIIKDTNYKQIFLYNFTDGLYYIEYNKQIFNKFEKTLIKQNRTDMKDPVKNIILVPINLLNLIKKY
jgi:vesicle coat complex subunit